MSLIKCCRTLQNGKVTAFIVSELLREPPPILRFKKEPLAQVFFFCEFCEISKNTFSTENLQPTASVYGFYFVKSQSQLFSLQLFKLRPLALQL